MKTLPEVISDWDRWANSAGFDERNADLQSCIRDIKEALSTYAAERERAEREHSKKEWANYLLIEMFDVLEEELREFKKAVVCGDFDGPHGAKIEAIHCRIVMDRIIGECQRREGG